MIRKAIALVVVGVLVTPCCAADEKGIIGSWKVIEMEYDGIAVDKDVAAKFAVVFAKDKVTFKGRLAGNGGKFDYTEGEDTHTYTLDSSNKPITIDIKDGCRTMKGIIEADGDTLKLSLSFAGDRPRKFTSKGETGVGYSVMKRQK